MNEDRVHLDPDYWGVARVHADQPSPFPSTPIADAARFAQSRGWIEEGFSSALYVSAGEDTHPPVYLRPEVLSTRGLTDIDCPDFFVYIDWEVPFSEDDFELCYPAAQWQEDDDRTTVRTLEPIIEVNSLGVLGCLLHLEVTSH